MECSGSDSRSTDSDSDSDFALDVDAAASSDFALDVDAAAAPDFALDSDSGAAAVVLGISAFIAAHCSGPMTWASAPVTVSARIGLA